jgi:hypothetical protein
MDQIEQILSLPAQTFLLLTAGYIGYRIAYTGKDTRHRTVDVIFIAVVFATIARLSIQGLGHLMDGALGKHPWVVSCLSVLVVIAIAAVWRKHLEGLVFASLRWSGVSHADRNRTAWESLIARSGHKPTEMVVRKKDGTAVLCERLADFENDPCGPCILGEDGSVVLYVTHFRPVRGEEWLDISESPDADWGRTMTYIPAGEISEISIRMV